MFWLATGINKETVKADKTTLTIEPNESVTSIIKVSTQDYVDSLDDEGLLSVFVIASVKVRVPCANRPCNNQGI